MNRPTILLLFWLAAALPLFGVEPGEKAPPFANPDLSSCHVLSRDYLGRGWLIVDFFCKKELPVLERLHQELGPRLPILVFATDAGGQPVVEAYFRATPTPLTVLLDRYHSAVKRYGVSEIPAGVVVLIYERIRALLPAGG